MLAIAHPQHYPIEIVNVTPPRRAWSVLDIDSGSAVTLKEERDWASIKRAFVVRNEAGVGKMLRQSPDLMFLTLFAARLCHSFFPAAVEFILEGMTDPEYETEELYLFVVLRTTLPVAEALTRLAQLEAFWVGSGIDRDLSINFDLEFI